MVSRFTFVFLLASTAFELALGQTCNTPATVPSFYNNRLPDPFIFNEVQGYEAGTLPPKPSTVTAKFSKSGNTGTLSVTAGTGSKTATWSNTITYPSGTAPSGGWPLLIVYESLSIPVPAGIATLIYPNSQIGQQNSSPASRGVGLFYNVYGNTATASAMTAWVWGVSRVIDALEITPSAGINLAKIGVTGCSRDGKGALMAGAFEQRIALTIPQESGSGGDTCWRLSEYEQSEGDQVQQSTEIVTENVWFSTNFDNYVSNLNVLPYDHHSLAAMVAPRALLSYENTDYEWLSPLSAYGCMTATHGVYQALGVPNNHGFVQAGGHAHCAFPTSLENSLFAFFDKFLLAETSTNTTFFTTNGLFNGTTWDPTYWINYTTPTLT